MYSLLQKKPTVQVDPYPHIVIEDALPWDLYEELENNFPESQVLNTEPFDNGICYRMKANRLLHPDEDIPEVWKSLHSITLQPNGLMKSTDCLNLSCQMCYRKNLQKMI